MNYAHIPEDIYQQIYEWVPRLCVSVVLTSPFGLALVKRNIVPEIGKWHLPGGRVFKKETVLDTANRVIKRELGVELPEDMGVVDLRWGVIQNLSEQYDGIDMHNVDLVLHVWTIRSDLAPHAGEGEARWFKTPPPVSDRHPTHFKFLFKNRYFYE